MVAHSNLHPIPSLSGQGPAVLPGLVVIWDVLSPVSPAVPVLLSGVAGSIRQAMAELLVVPLASFVILALS